MNPNHRSSHIPKKASGHCSPVLIPVLCGPLPLVWLELQVWHDLPCVTTTQPSKWMVGSNSDSSFSISAVDSCSIGYKDARLIAWYTISKCKRGGNRWLIKVWVQGQVRDDNFRRADHSFINAMIQVTDMNSCINKLQFNMPQQAKWSEQPASPPRVGFYTLCPWICYF